jgi:MoaA/NifB/PqqE/SkfB family radical SAM enzyme/2-polyprenyl-3-methyl-5-hydroxy-6-metoxy-1,4-benzoquinol methylase
METKIKLDARIKHLNFGLINRKPIFIVKMALKYARKKLFGKNSLRGVVFASSYVCNFNCTHCYANRFRDTGLPPLSLDEKAAVIKECLDLGAISFDFVGGEIGISSDIDRLLTICKPHKTHISLASNGWDLSREKIRNLKNKGIDKISISIDSGSPEEHDKFRRKNGSYNRCLEAIYNIRKEGLTPVIITCVSHGDTKKETFQRLINYAIENKVELVFSVAIPFGQWENNMSILCDEEDIKYMREMHEKHHFITRDCYENLGSWGCPAAKQIIYISEYGDVMPCPFTHISFGNVKYESIRNIRERMLKIPELKEYHSVCLAGEDVSFIKNHLSATFGTKPYPPSAKKAFLGNKDINAPVIFSQDIKKVERFCPICGSESKKIIASGREHEFNNTTDDLFFVAKCLDCDTVYLSPRPADSMLKIIYPKQYYCYKDQFIASASNKSLLMIIKEKLNNQFGFPRQIKKIAKSLSENKEQVRVLDVGCGSGSALDVFRQVFKEEIETTGLDIDEDVLELVVKKGHKVIKARIEEVALPENYFDIIYSSNVIEHIADPLGMMKKVSNALKSNGVFLCETPNFDSFDARLFSRSGHWGGFHFPRHWTFFTPKTFQKMADRSGLIIKKITYNPVPIFWIWTAHSYLYRKKGRKDLADKFFPLVESKDNFLRSLALKVVFTFTDMFLKIFTGKTSLMSITLKKRT